MPDSEPAYISRVALPTDTIHIWHARISAPPWPLSSLWAVLTRAEHDRAADYVSQVARHAYTLRRGLLRILLGCYLGVPARELQIAATPWGKPEIVPCPGTSPLEFSLSQSGDVILYAISHEPLGVDVECIATTYDVAAIARVYFTDAERTWLSELPAVQQQAMALRIWTYKEAYSKAIGTGMTDELGTVCMVHNGAPGGRIRSAAGRHSRQQWTSLDVSAVPECVATVVYPYRKHYHRTLSIRPVSSLSPNAPQLEA